jgi:DNA-binding response OmpR family regulator
MEIREYKKIPDFGYWHNELLIARMACRDVAVGPHQDGLEMLGLAENEFRVFDELMQNCGIAIRPTEIVTVGFPGSFDSAGNYIGSLRIISTYLSRANRKLRDRGMHNSPFETIRGFGYVFRPNDITPTS